MIRLDNLQTTDPLGNETTYSYDYLQIDNRSVTRKIGYIGHLRADFRRDG